LPPVLQQLIDEGPTAGGRMTANYVTYPPEQWPAHVAECAGLAQGWLTALGEALQRTDGPAPPNTLIWQGTPHPLQPKLWRLLAALWDKENVELEELVRKVWREDGEDVTDSTVRAAISRLNDRMSRILIPWEYRLRGGHVIRKKFPVTPFVGAR